jgi:hypothetical protein
VSRARVPAPAPSITSSSSIAAHNGII